MESSILLVIHIKNKRNDAPKQSFIINYRLVRKAIKFAKISILIYFRFVVSLILIFSETNKRLSSVPEPEIIHFRS